MTNPPQQQADQQAVVAAYQQQTATARAQLAAAIAALWATLPDYRNKSMRQFAAEAIPVVEAGMSHMQATTAGYLATLLDLGGGALTPVATRTPTIASVRNGADPADVYGRGFHLVWRKLHDGTTLDQAVQAGQTRAVQTAVTDLQLAKTHTAQQVLARNRHVVGYRRVLEGPHSCALCIVAATVRYHKADLMPMHPACDCAIAPIIGDTDPGRTIDHDLLAAVHQTVADKFGADSTAARQIHGAFHSDGSPVLYRDVLVVHDHGELGPVLGIRGEHWTGLSDPTK